MSLVRLIKPRSFKVAHLLICNILQRESTPHFYSHPNLLTNIKAMSQRSITSFFKVTPSKPTPVKAEDVDSKTETNSTTSPVANGSETKSSKRQRIESSGSEQESPKTSNKSPSISPLEKKKVKRQRIESSDSESEQSSKSDDIKPKLHRDKVPNPKTYGSPKNKKSKTLALTEKNGNEETSPKSKVKKETATTRSPSPNSRIEIKQEKDSSKKANMERSGPFEKKENIKVKEEISDGVVEKVPETEYNPAKPRYHPIRDACWAAGEPVPYLALAKTLEAIEATSARLRIVDILSNYLRSTIALTPEDLLPSIYLCLNQLAPAYHSLELGIAETYLMRAVGQCTGMSVAQVRSAAGRSGDLGRAAEQARAAQRTVRAAAPLRVRGVFAALRDIARITGQASVNKKISKIQALYVACRHSEARFLIRSLEGKLRIGLAEQSVLQALAQAVALTPPVGADPAGPPVLDASAGVPPDEFKRRVDEHALVIKTTYCECPNYEAVVPALLAHGAAALPRHCRLTPGVPLKPMLAHPTRGVRDLLDRFEGEPLTCEWKYDGERAQLHVPPRGAGAPAVFSRNQEDNTSKYPDVVRRLPALLRPSVESCVLDCEAVAYDTANGQILPFQVLATRKRKDAVEADIKVQVCVFLFDLLYLNGRPLVREPLAARRALLREHFNEVPGEWQFATSQDCSSAEEVQQFLEEAVRGSCEGLMVKTLRGDRARYDIARRSHNWLKLKKDYLEGVGDSVDCVVLGAYRGRGRRAGGAGGFLLACRDAETDEFQALCRVGTGFTDADLLALAAALEPHVIDAPRPYYRFDESHRADVWYAAAAVWEVRCADLSLSPTHRAAIGLVDPDKGISLRFPRFIRVREDKTPEQATSARQIADMYLAQDQVKNQTKTTVNYDEFY